MDKYTILDFLPKSIVLDVKNKESVKAMGKWFLKNNESRLPGLLAEVNRDPEFADWKMDFTPQSFATLSDWFEKHITTRPEYIKHNPSNPDCEPRPSYEFTALEKSYIFDVGIYLGTALIKNHPQWKWFQNMKTTTRDLLWGHMVIGKKKCPHSMWWIVDTCAAKVVLGSYKKHQLQDVYNRLSDLLESYASTE